MLVGCSDPVRHILTSDKNDLFWPKPVTQPGWPATFPPRVVSGGHYLLLAAVLTNIHFACILHQIDIELGEFIRGYSEGSIRENNQPRMLILKNWPSPSASEEFLLYQRPEFISKLPLLEYIHSKWGLLNLAAKLPHYSLQNDVGPKILISYGMYDEVGQGDSVNMLHFNMRDVVSLFIFIFSTEFCFCCTFLGFNTPLSFMFLFLNWENLFIYINSNRVVGTWNSRW